MNIYLCLKQFTLAYFTHSQIHQAFRNHLEVALRFCFVFDSTNL